MTQVLAIVIGILFAVCIFLLLQRSMIRIVMSIILLSQVANLTIFACGKLFRSKPPLIPETLEKITANVADPLPQALILTAIVISFGVLAFSMVMFYTTCTAMQTDDIDDLREVDV